MKNLLLSLGLCLALTSITLSSTAQERTKSGVAIQPLWGPTGFNLVYYYYLPDIESYYSVPEKKFIYRENDNWIFSSTLPEKYKSYDLFSGYKVVLNRPHPYMNYLAHKARYARYKGQLNKQESIKNSTNPKYYVVEGHPMSAQLQNVVKQTKKGNAGSTGN